MSTFQCKEFTIQQDRAAMKVGTDSILLGSWVAVKEVERILDIGAGTGLLALMMAQRSNAFTIDAVEIDDDAYEEAVDNFENSPWGDRLFCYHASMQVFAEEMDEKYDLILSNPPFFKPSTIKSEGQRNVARQTHLLDHATLLKNTKKLLNKNGSCAFIIPYEIEVSFIALAKDLTLFPSRVTRTKDTEDAAFKRSLLQFTHQEVLVDKNELVLKNKDKTYSDAFIALTKDFYLDL